MKTKTVEYVSQNIRKVPRKLLTRFKIACAKNTITMHDCLVQFMRQYAKENK